MRKIWICWLLSALSACATHGVHCDDRLQPINAPKAKVAATDTAAGAVP